MGGVTIESSQPSSGLHFLISHQRVFFISLRRPQDSVLVERGVGEEVVQGGQGECPSFRPGPALQVLPQETCFTHF